MLVIMPVLTLGVFPELQYDDAAFYTLSSLIFLGVVSGYLLITWNAIFGIWNGEDVRGPNDEQDW